MKLCNTCKGHAFVNDDICNDCGGEGIVSATTFVVGKINRRKNLSHDEYQKKKAKETKFDKKNASRE